MYIDVNDIIFIDHAHRRQCYRVTAVIYGAVGCQSVVEMECVNTKESLAGKLRVPICMIEQHVWRRVS